MSTNITGPVRDFAYNVYADLDTMVATVAPGGSAETVIYFDESLGMTVTRTHVLSSAGKYVMTAFPASVVTAAATTQHCTTCTCPN